MSKKTNKQYRQEFADKSLKFNRYFAVRYGFAAFFFANLNWFIFNLLSKTSSSIIPLILLVFGLGVIWELLQIYHHPNRKIKYSYYYYGTQLAVNTLLLLAAIYNNIFDWLFPYINQSDPAFRFFALWLGIGWALAAFLLLRVHRIRHNRDRYYQRLNKYYKESSQKKESEKNV